MNSLTYLAPPQGHTARLRRLGWNDHFEKLATQQDINPAKVARVLNAHRNHFLVTNGKTEWTCSPAGKLRHSKKKAYPVTGDWVLANADVIEQVLDRNSTLGRGESGSHGSRKDSPSREQAIGANIDTAFIACGLDRDFNLRRIERYLALIYNCSINPVAVLTKADLHDDPATFRQDVEAIAFGVPVVLTSMVTGSGVDELQGFLAPGQTVAMIGSSGAGKSTLANLLYGSEVQATSAVSNSVGKGRHTTTTRELIAMPQGGMLMDNPGIREIAFPANDGGVEAAFPDIERLAAQCRFSDCTHAHEPGCAVLDAVENGTLKGARLESYHKMINEMNYLSDRREKSADRLEKERWRDVSLRIRQMKK